MDKKIQLIEYFKTSLPWFKLEITKVKDTRKNGRSKILQFNAANLHSLIEDIDIKLNEASDS